MAKNLISKIMVGGGLLTTLASFVVCVFGWAGEYCSQNNLEFVNVLKKNNPQLVIDSSNYERELKSKENTRLYGMLGLTGGLVIATVGDYSKKKNNKQNQSAR